MWYFSTDRCGRAPAALGTRTPEASPSRAAVLRSQGARDTGGRDKQMAVDLDHTRPGNRNSRYVPARTEG
jgi:hypothetical protein